MTHVLASSHGGSVAVFVVIGILVVAGLAVASYLAQQKRRKQFTAWAAQHGFAYEIRDDRYDDMPWGHPFGVGFGRAALDVLTGARESGRPVLCFTYLYKTQSSNGKTTTTQSHYYSVYSARLQKALPELHVGREGFFSTIARAVGVHDIEFESEDFNRAFKVQGDDRKFASDVVNPQMMQFLLDGNAPGFAIVGTDIVYVDKGKLALDSVLPTLDYLEAVIARIPDFVWDAR